MPDPKPGMVWRQLYWQRPLAADRVAACLRQWASDERSPRMIIETRFRPGGVQYLLGWPRGAEHMLVPLRTIPGLTNGKPLADRTPVTTAGSLRASTRHRPLRSSDPEAVVRAILAVGVRLRPGEELVFQLVLGPRRIPLAVPNHSPSSMVMPWWQVVWLGSGGQVDGEKRSALRTKVSDHGFACTMRLGVTAAEPRRRQTLILGLLAALRSAEAPGVRLRLRCEGAQQLNAASFPVWRWPLRMGVPELVGLTAWPLGDDALPGQPSLHPKSLPPAPSTIGDERILATASVAGTETTLQLPMAEALHHLHVIGPTGTGKSTLLANLILQDITAGRGLVVIEPKGDLVEDVLARVPADHRDRIVVLDPSDSAPVGLNPLSSQGRPELVVDGMLAVFKQLYGKAIGPRSQDILYAGLLTLTQRPDASLVMLPLLLTNPGFRRSLTAGIRDPLTLEPFWNTFEAWSDAERAAAIAPVQNKLRPLLRPGLRAVLGQRAPRFEIGQVFTEGKVLLVPLRRGVIGPEAASLLGSLVVAQLWQAVQARSALPASARQPVSIVIDELQDYLHLPTDLGDALAQARGYGVAFTLAHQFLGQVPRTMRTAILANVRSRVAFQLPHDDALVFEKAHPEIEAADFESLGKYEAYLSLFTQGQVSGYASGRTRALPPRMSNPNALRVASRRRYGQPLDEVEAGFAELLTTNPDDLGPTGRRRRSS